MACWVERLCMKTFFLPPSHRPLHLNKEMFNSLPFAAQTRTLHTVLCMYPELPTRFKGQVSGSPKLNQFFFGELWFSKKFWTGSLLWFSCMNFFCEIAVSTYLKNPDSSILQERKSGDFYPDNTCRKPSFYITLYRPDGFRTENLSRCKCLPFFLFLFYVPIGTCQLPSQHKPPVWAEMGCMYVCLLAPTVCVPGHCYLIHAPSLTLSL